MKVKFETWFRGGLFFLCVWLAWGLWATARSATNQIVTKPETNAPSASLVKQLERLDERYLTFGLDRIPWLHDYGFWGEPLWKYLASLIYILLAFYIAKLLDLIALVWLKRLAVRTRTQADDILLNLLHGPVKVILFVLLLHLGITVFNWSPTAKT